MAEESTKTVAAPWRIPVTVESVPEDGQHFDLVADEGVRAAVARLAGVREVLRLEAKFEVTRRGANGLHVTGLVSATVGQNCVVTLEPLSNDLQETVDLVFLPRKADAATGAGAEAEKPEPKWDDPEPLIGGVVDLGALATEFLILGLDPYPRKPDAVFQPPQEEKPDAGPFAALAKIAKSSP